MNLIKLLYSCLLCTLAFPMAAFACSFIYTPQKYIHVVKMYGDKNPDIKLYEAVHTLGYEGKDKFQIFSDSKQLILKQENGSLCTYDQAEKPTCFEAKNRGLDLDRVHDFDKKRKLTLLIQINDDAPKAYVFKKRRVRATEEHHDQIRAQGWNICYEIDEANP